MYEKIKNKVDKELAAFAKNMAEDYSLKKISPLLSDNIRSYIIRDGKRARPILFVLSYLGYSKKPAFGLYRSSLSIEILHDFMLIHDDIIDKSDTRRGKPAMHKMFDDILAGHKNLKFNGQDLAIVVGDVMYAMAIDTFLSIQEDPKRKELALKKFIEAAMYTGSGEFIELICGMENIDKITKGDIYKIYNYKTAHYTFACPLSIGALLAGADKNEIAKISKYGSLLGKAFQIKDDISGMFEEESKTGKSALADLQEAKKTILIWYAYNNSSTRDKNKIKIILSKKIITRVDLYQMREIIGESGALLFAKNEISSLLKEALCLIKASKMKKSYKDFLYNYSQKILS